MAGKEHQDAIVGAKLGRQVILHRSKDRRPGCSGLVETDDGESLGFQQIADRRCIFHGITEGAPLGTLVVINADHDGVALGE